ncbi:MAG: hypothetical protein IPG24_21490 [Leptospiraceae bacterium]|nr:hypothetical protein [Leptospiraceae bacterium]
MSDKILLYTQNKEITEQVKTYVDDLTYAFNVADNMDNLTNYLKSDDTWLLIYDFLDTSSENQKNLGNILSEYPFNWLFY